MVINNGFFSLLVYILFFFLCYILSLNFQTPVTAAATVNSIMFDWLTDSIFHLANLGWSCGAKVLGKLPVPGRPTNLDYSRARAYCACSRCGWGLFGHFFSHLSLLFSFSLSLGDGPI